MSDLATVTHDYRKAAAQLPALKSTWISQSLSAQATNGFPENTSSATYEGSVASGSNLILSSPFLFRVWFLPLKAFKLNQDSQQLVKLL